MFCPQECFSWDRSHHKKRGNMIHKYKLAWLIDIYFAWLTDIFFVWLTDIYSLQWLQSRHIQPCFSASPEWNNNLAILSEATYPNIDRRKCGPSIQYHSIQRSNSTVTICHDRTCDWVADRYLGWHSSFKWNICTPCRIDHNTVSVVVCSNVFHQTCL